VNRLIAEFLWLRRLTPVTRPGAIDVKLGLNQFANNVDDIIIVNDDSDPGQVRNIWLVLLL